MIQKITKVIALLCCGLGIGVAHASTVRQAVEHVLATSRLDKTGMGIIVTSVKTGHVLYAQNSDRLYTPASVQKLFTATAALEYLKPTFRFKTGFYTQGFIRHDVLQGNLYIKFSGDPTFKSADLARMMDELHNMHIKRITGHVYIDNYAYNQVPYPPGWIWDDLSYSYAAPMDAIIIDHNKFAVSFQPSKVVGQAPKITTNLPAGVVHFENTMQSTRTYSDACPVTIYSDMHNNYRVAGCLDNRWGVQSRSLAIRDVLQFAKVEVANMLALRNIHYDGDVRQKITPHHVTPLVVHNSQPLGQVIRHMLKKSDNLYTDAIFKKIGETYYNRPGSWQNSLMALKKILGKETGINFKHSLFTDGVGLSRYNLITPHQLAKLLFFIYHNTAIKPSLLAALPIAGVDGTLEGRMMSDARGKRVRAKTGSMTGVSTLAGYVITHHHGTLAFAIMMNDFVGGLGRYRYLQDRICEALARI